MKFMSTLPEGGLNMSRFFYTKLGVALALLASAP